jgi:hypothetical protein
MKNPCKKSANLHPPQGYLLQIFTGFNKTSSLYSITRLEKKLKKLPLFHQASSSIKLSMGETRTPISSELSFPEI